jgi:hypothetical protein
MHSGSVLKGTVKTTLESVTTKRDVGSDEPMESIVTLLEKIKGSWFAESLAVRQVVLLSSITLLGEAVQFKELPGRR